MENKKVIYIIAKFKTQKEKDEVIAKAKARGLDVSKYLRYLIKKDRIK